MRKLTCDVAIVGAGIAGSALACALRDSGHSVLLVERRSWNQSLDTARGDNLQPYTVELLDQWNVLKAFFDSGAERRLGQDFYTASGELVLEQRYSDLDIPHPYALVVHHEAIANIFLQLALESPGVDILRPATVIGLEGSQSQRTLQVRADELVQTVEARLIVGADGSGSGVRHALGIDTARHRYRRQFVDLFGADVQDNPDRLARVYAGAAGFTFALPRLGGNLKLGLTIESSDVAFWRHASNVEIEAAVRARAPALPGFSGEVGGFYPVQRSDAATYGYGNVALVGDAAHAMHPIMGMGLNVGLRDVEALLAVLGDDIEDVPAAVARYATERPAALTDLLEKNHLLALDLDEGPSSSYAVWLTTLASVDAGQRRQILAESAGYPADSTDQ